METAEKIYLVPQHQLDRLKTMTSGTENVRKTVENDLDETMRLILSRSDLIPYEKAKLYASALQRFLNIVKQGAEETTQLTLTLPSDPENKTVTGEDQLFTGDDIIKRS